MNKLKYQLEHSTHLSENSCIISVVVMGVLSIAYVALLIRLTLSESGVYTSNAVRAMLMLYFTIITILPFAIILKIIQLTIEILCSQDAYMIHLWIPKQDSQNLKISKSSIIANILSNKYKFTGYVHNHIKNTDECKTLISIPITEDEFDIIAKYIEDYENQKHAYMNPTIILEN